MTSPPSRSAVTEMKVGVSFFERDPPYLLVKIIGFSKNEDFFCESQTIENLSFLFSQDLIPSF